MLARPAMPATARVALPIIAASGSVSTPIRAACGQRRPAATRNRAEPVPGSTIRAGARARAAQPALLRPTGPRGEVRPGGEGLTGRPPLRRRADTAERVPQRIVTSQDPVPGLGDLICAGPRGAV